MRKPGATPFSWISILSFLVLATWPCFSSAAGKIASSTFRKPFGEIFLYGQIALEPGGGKLTLPKSGQPMVARKKSVIVPTGSVLETGARETAALRFGGGSRILIGPASRLRIRRFSVEIGTGSMFIRHLGSDQPLKLTGSQTLLLQPGSLVEVQTDQGGLLVRVQAGEARVPSGKEPIRAGDSVRVKADGISPAGRSFPLQTWVSPPSPETTGLSDSELDEVFGKVAEVAGSLPASTPSPSPEPPPVVASSPTVPEEPPLTGPPPSDDSSSGAGGVFRGGDDDY